MTQSSKVYYGKETEKAIHNFPFSTHTVHWELIVALVEIKKAAAIANARNKVFPDKLRDAIVQACDELLGGEYKDQFKIPSLQGGAGTSINMNVNEVIAGRATEIYGNTIHPNDHVNYAQSTNDVNPSALKIAVYRLSESLISVVSKLVAALEEKAIEFKHVYKLGRTHLQDAVPITLGEEFTAYASMLKRDIDRMKAFQPLLLELNLGGTAVGNAINAPKEYRTEVYKELKKSTGLPVVPAVNLMAQTSCQSDFCNLSQLCVLLTLDASKIANDLRLLSSGPTGGIGEIRMEELQSGSSIMPGKVNPVLPESVNQLYFVISGNNLTIEHAAHASQLELGVMFPILADRLITSLKAPAEVLTNFTVLCIKTIHANEKRCTEILEKSTAYATLLSPYLGYDQVSAIVKESLANNKSIREIVLEKKLMDEQTFQKTVQSLPR